MDLLLNDNFAPITSSIGYIKEPIKNVVDTFLQWQNKIQSKRKVKLKTVTINGTLSDVLYKLTPLTSIESIRYLFVPTINNYTAYFDNGWRGADVYSNVSTITSMLQSEGVRADFIPHTLKSEYDSRKGRYGGTIWEVYSYENKDILKMKRTIADVFDGSKWTFYQSGVPFDFENISLYTKKKIRDRFTFETLNSYLLHMHIDALNEEFYKTDEECFLIEKEGSINKGIKYYSLNEARISIGL